MSDRPAPMRPVRLRPLGIGPLRAFEAVARHLNFRAAGEELHLTQSAVSRQIQGLEEELGAALFQRGTRQVSLTTQGATLLRAVAPGLERLDTAVRQIRAAQARPRVTVTTFASFATLWLIPRLEAFQRAHPGLDIRIVATDVLIEADDPEIDLALRYCLPERLSGSGFRAERLFGERLTPLVSPWLLERARRGELPPLTTLTDLAGHALLEEDTSASDPTGSAGWSLSWRHWLAAQGHPRLEPARWISFNYTHQQVQAAQAGQGVALGRLPLVAELLARGDLVEPFGPGVRQPMAGTYWLLSAPAAVQRPGVDELRRWILDQAAAVRRDIGDEVEADVDGSLGEGD